MVTGGKCRISSVHEFTIRVGDRCFQHIPVEINVVSEAEAMERRLFHHPSERDLRQQVAFVSPANIRVGANKPPLFDAGESSWRGNYRFWVLRLSYCPERGCESVPVLIYRKRLESVFDWQSQPCVEPLKGRTTYTRDVTERHT